MFSRRPGARFNRGRIAQQVAGSSAPVVPSTPDAILGGTLVAWHRADTGVTQATGVSGWSDRTANGHAFGQATGTAQPAYSSTGGANNTPFLTFDGTSDWLQNNTLVFGNPGTVIVYLRQNAWTSNRQICANNGVTAPTLLQLTSTPRIGQNNTSSVNAQSTLALSTWGRVAGIFTNSFGDNIRAAAGVVGGVAHAGAGSDTGRRLGTNGAASSFWSGAIAEVLHITGEPTVLQWTQLDQYFLDRYGAL